MSHLNRAVLGRTQLQAWEADKPQDFFAADKNLQNVLQRYLAADYPRHATTLGRIGKRAATDLDQAAKIEDRIGNHPRLERWSGIGERIEQIEFHPNHDLIGQVIWESEIMAMQATPGHTVTQMALFYLFSHNGEGGHMCALACTSGMIRALQHVGSDAVKAQFLPPLLDPNYHTMQHAAQFLTEVQGGSDVGANAVVATPHPDGTWRISGEKWFCSNINAHQFLMTARPNNAVDGTKGLGLFLVPRTLDDGSTNGFYLRRLKDKLGTRTLASAEVDFVEAVAYPIGAIDQGFKHVVELVLNTSRLMNAVACTGIMQRAFIEAAAYACHREAFGKPIATYPLVQETIADIYSETVAATASSFFIAHLLDVIELGTASADESALFRLLVNVNKYITSIRGSAVVHQAIEVFGGNGAIESFSILPRLYRDMIVLESWEGAHNVLCLQVLRDITKYHLHEAFFRWLNTALPTIHHADLMPVLPYVEQGIAQLHQMLGQMMQGGERFAQAHARRLVDLIAHLAQTTLLLVEAQWEFDQELPTVKADAVQHFAHRHLNPAYDPLRDLAYLDRIARLMHWA